jgi:hypothetical protein
MQTIPKILDYELKIGRVVNLHPETNTVDVKLITKFNHEAYIAPRMFLDYGEVLEQVEIRMTTDEYYFATPEDKLLMAYNKDAWSIFLPDFAYANLERPIYVYIMVYPTQDPPLDLASIPPNYIISCFKDNQYKQEDWSNPALNYGHEFSQRLFPTNTMYVVFGMNNIGYFWDPSTDTLITTTVETPDISTLWYSKTSTSNDDLIDDIFGATSPVFEGLDFGSWSADTNPDGYIIESVGLLQTDATYYFYNPPGDVLDEIVNIPTVGNNGSPNGTLSGTCSPTPAFTLTTLDGTVEELESSFYYESHYGSFTFTASICDQVISTTVPYELTSKQYIHRYGMTIGPANYYCLGRSGIGFRNSVAEVIASEIYVRTPFVSHRRLPLLEAYINTLMPDADVNGIWVGLASKPYGIAGAAFGDAVTLSLKI